MEPYNSQYFNGWSSDCLDRRTGVSAFNPLLNPKADHHTPAMELPFFLVLDCLNS